MHAHTLATFLRLDAAANVPGGAVLLATAVGFTKMAGLRTLSGPRRTSSPAA